MENEGEGEENEQSIVTVVLRKEIPMNEIFLFFSMIQTIAGGRRSKQENHPFSRTVTLSLCGVFGRVSG